MTGNVLIVDAVATNRIVLKVKLSVAFYRVLQAGSGQEALEIARTNPPDLIVASSNLPDLSIRDLITGIRRICGETAPPVAVLSRPRGYVSDPAATPQPGRRAGTQDRVRALEDGAADVIDMPCRDVDLLARLRALMRYRAREAEIAQHADAARVLGFAEDKAGFAARERVAVMSDRSGGAEALSARLGPHCHARLLPLEGDLLQARKSLANAPDLIVMDIGSGNPESALTCMSDILASPRLRHTRLMAVLRPEIAHLAAPALDLGAGDVALADADDRELSLRLSRQLARKRSDDRLRNHLEIGMQAALIDPLTGLYNRRYAMAVLDQMRTDAIKRGRSLALMIVDLDHFKSVNDTHGHGAGDAVLTRLAERMRAQVRGDTLIARLGGEEFLIVQPDATAQTSRKLAERLCRVIRDVPVPLPDRAGEVQVTASIGVKLTSAEDFLTGKSADTLLREADTALYEAKSLGRNTISYSILSAA